MVVFGLRLFELNIMISNYALLYNILQLDSDHQELTTYMYMQRKVK
jgi:hypothetical protein